MTQSRLQKIIAQAGIASRRRAEEFILSGRVRVNGKIVAQLGAKADPEIDQIEIDGKPIANELPLTLLMNKPRGVVCTLSDPEGRPTVADYIKNIRERVYPVGRLDFATSGALLMTNDGDLSYALTHPKHKVEKVYLLKVAGKVDEVVLEKWRMGVDIGDVVTRPAEVFKVEEDDNFTWIQVTLREGRNRQIRRMGEATGLEVKKLKRISFAGLTIEGVRIGEYRILQEAELRKIRKLYHIPTPNEKKGRQTKTRRDSSPREATERIFTPDANAHPRRGRRPRNDAVFSTQEFNPQGRRRDRDESFTTHEFKPARKRENSRENHSISKRDRKPQKKS